MRQYCVYILASNTRVIYIGITGDLTRRVAEHKEGKIKGFTQQYKIRKLVYYEVFDNVLEAIQREKQLKNWRRDKKVGLIEEYNPGWCELMVG